MWQALKLCNYLFIYFLLCFLFMSILLSCPDKHCVQFLPQMELTNQMDTIMNLINVLFVKTWSIPMLFIVLVYKQWGEVILLAIILSCRYYY